MPAPNPCIGTKANLEFVLSITATPMYAHLLLYLTSEPFPQHRATATQIAVPPGQRIDPVAWPDLR
jgi:hypothetical protein